MSEEKLKLKIKEIFPNITDKSMERMIMLVYEFNDKKRTSAQNRALHLLFSQLSDECMEKGIEMRDLVRDNIPIECTPENIKWLWKRVQKALFKTQSTTELKKAGQIEVVYDNFNKLIIERTKGEIALPPFPHDPNKQKNLADNYKSHEGEVKF